jgi:hypothetical protein
MTTALALQLPEHDAHATASAQYKGCSNGNGGVTGALTISQNGMSAQATEMGSDHCR